MKLGGVEGSHGNVKSKVTSPREAMVTAWGRLITKISVVVDVESGSVVCMS